MSKFIELAKKLKALAEQGVGGEKVNAEIKLRALMQKHNISMSDIEEPVLVERVFIIPDKYRRLFMYIVMNVCGDVSIYKSSRKRTAFFVEMSAEDYILVTQKFDFYSKAYEQKLKVFLRSFIMANDLFMKINDDDEDPPESLNSMSDEYLEALEMASKIKKDVFFKQLKS